jgi:hypothetical protein
VLVLHVVTVVSSQTAMALPPVKVKLMNDGNQHRTQ